MRRHPQVESVSLFATKYAFLKTKEEIEGVLVKGVARDYNAAHFSRFIKEGRFIQFNDSSYSREIMLSDYTARQLSLKVNDRVMIYFTRPDGSPRPDRLTICGIYKTGIEEYDRTFAVGDLKLLQRLNGWDSTGAGGY